jgi:hypothetical protein
MSSKDTTNYSSSHDSNNNDTDEIEISKEFQENVIAFVKFDDLIRQKQSEITDLKKKRKPKEDYILKYLDHIDETTIEISGGKLRKNKAETKVPLNQDYIKAAIATKVSNPDIIEDIMKKMDTRPTKVNINIKRTSKRAPNKKTV